MGKDGPLVFVYAECLKKIPLSFLTVACIMNEYQKFFILLEI